MPVQSFLRDIKLTYMWFLAIILLFGVNGQPSLNNQRVALVQLYESVDPQKASIRGWSQLSYPCDPNTKTPVWMGIQQCDNAGFVTALNLASRNLNGTIPDNEALWGALATLQSLDMSNNQLVGGVPLAMQRTSSLLILKLNMNSLDGALPQWTDLGQLEVLFLQSNNFVGTLPVSWANMQRLKVVNVSGNLLQGAIPEAWVPKGGHGLVDLRHLDLQDTLMMCGGVPPALDQYATVYMDQASYAGCGGYSVALGPASGASSLCQCGYGPTLACIAVKDQMCALAQEGCAILDAGISVDATPEEKQAMGQYLMQENCQLPEGFLVEELGVVGDTEKVQIRQDGNVWTVNGMPLEDCERVRSNRTSTYHNCNGTVVVVADVNGREVDNLKPSDICSCYEEEAQSMCLLFGSTLCNSDREVEKAFCDPFMDFWAKGVLSQDAKEFADQIGGVCFASQDAEPDTCDCSSPSITAGLDLLQSTKCKYAVINECRSGKVGSDFCQPGLQSLLGYTDARKLFRAMVDSKCKGLEQIQWEFTLDRMTSLEFDARAQSDFVDALAAVTGLPTDYIQITKVNGERPFQVERQVAQLVEAGPLPRSNGDTLIATHPLETVDGSRRLQGAQPRLVSQHIALAATATAHGALPRYRRSLQSFPFISEETGKGSQEDLAMALRQYRRKLLLRDQPSTDVTVVFTTDSPDGVREDLEDAQESGELARELKLRGLTLAEATSDQSNPSQTQAPQDSQVASGPEKGKGLDVQGQDTGGGEAGNTTIVLSVLVGALLAAMIAICGLFIFYSKYRYQEGTEYSQATPHDLAPTKSGGLRNSDSSPSEAYARSSRSRPSSGLPAKDRPAVLWGAVQSRYPENSPISGDQAKGRWSPKATPGALPEKRPTGNFTQLPSADISKKALKDKYSSGYVGSGPGRKKDFESGGVPASRSQSKGSQENAPRQRWGAAVALHVSRWQGRMHRAAQAAMQRLHPVQQGRYSGAGQDRREPVSAKSTSSSERLRSQARPAPPAYMPVDHADVESARKHAKDAAHSTTTKQATLYDSSIDSQEVARPPAAGGQLSTRSSAVGSALPEQDIPTADTLSAQPSQQLAGAPSHLTAEQMVKAELEAIKQDWAQEYNNMLYQGSYPAEQRSVRKRYDNNLFDEALRSQDSGADLLQYVKGYSSMSNVSEHSSELGAAADRPPGEKGPKGPGAGGSGGVGSKP